MQTRSVAIIGAGVSGIAATKSALESGLEPTCFEQRADIGGLWYKRDAKEEGIEIAARCYDNLILNTSKHFFEYSDFSHTQSPNTLDTREEAKAYLDAYATHFAVHRRVRLNTTVTKLQKAPDYAKSGAWDVESLERGVTAIVERFDAVIIASGHFSKAFVPDFRGLELFKGRVVHSGQYESHSKFSGQTVAIIGSGVSAIDVATTLAPHASKVHLVSRSGVTLLPQFLGPGRPFFSQFYSRSFNELGWEEQNAWLAERAVPAFDLDELGLTPNAGILKGTVALATEGFNSLARSGKIKAWKGEIRQFTESGLELVGHAEPLHFDAAILATGFLLQLPFLQDEGILPKDHSDIEWWKNVDMIDMQFGSILEIYNIKYDKPL